MISWNDISQNLFAFDNFRIGHFAKNLYVL